jgi:hypothetical protein
VTPGTQGNASETKVGIYQGNQLQISKKMRLINDSYNEMFEDLGKRYDWGLWDHASEDEMVRLVSTDGVGWEKITKEDKDPEYVVVAIASEAEKMENSDLVRAKLEALMSVEKDPNQMKLVNVKAHLEEKYRLAGFSDEKIDKLMNTKSDATDEVMSEAKKDIENILSGKKMSLNFGATTSYLQFISDWILKNSGDLNPEKKKLLEDHFEKHVPIAMKNAEQEQFRTEQLMKQRQAESIVVNPKTASDVSIGAPVMPTI